jgi:group I intron endonuclease
MELTKLSGIYSIKNKLNHKQYIGHSKNITFRWYHHLNNLIESKHPNNKLQEDFNTYGLSAFDFSILELIEGKDNLITKEQEYLNSIDFDSNYNIYNSIKKEKEPDVDEFIDYIESNWLVKDIDNTVSYRIYKDEDKQEIINKAIKCHIFNLSKSHITFNKVMNFMKDTLGYTIESGRFQIKRKKYTYKLIVEFDEDYMEEMKCQQEYIK